MSRVNFWLYIKLGEKGLSVKSPKGNYPQSNRNRQKSGSQKPTIHDLLKKFFAHFTNFPSRLIANHEQSIIPKTLYVNIFKSPLKLGVINNIATHVAARLVKSPAKNLTLGKSFVLIIPKLTGAIFLVKWWAVQDLNLRPPRCDRGALPTELTAPFTFYQIPSCASNPNYLYSLHGTS